MNIRWTKEASENLEEIHAYIAQDNQTAALNTVRTIFNRIEQLATFTGLAASGVSRIRVNWRSRLFPMLWFIG
jgi:plasmid stabilization system protein ParE